MTQTPANATDEQASWATALGDDPTDQRVRYNSGRYHFCLELYGDGTLLSKEESTPDWDHGQVVNVPQQSLPVWRRNDGGRTFTWVRQLLVEGGFPVVEEHPLFKGEVESSIAVRLGDERRASVSIPGRLQDAVPAWSELCRRLDGELHSMRSGAPTEWIENPNLHLWPDEILRDRMPPEAYAAYLEERRGGSQGT